MKYSLLTTLLTLSLLVYHCDVNNADTVIINPTNITYPTPILNGNITLPDWIKFNWNSSSSSKSIQYSNNANSLILYQTDTLELPLTSTLTNYYDTIFATTKTDSIIKIDTIVENNILDTIIKENISTSNDTTQDTLHKVNRIINLNFITSNSTLLKVSENNNGMFSIHLFSSDTLTVQSYHFKQINTQQIEFYETYVFKIKDIIHLNTQRISFSTAQRISTSKKSTFQKQE